MLNIKRLFSFTLTVFFIVSAAAAQDSGGAARQESLNLMVFKGVYGSDGLEIRNKTLKDIGEAVARGNTGDEIYSALEYLSMEGLKNKAMDKGQLLNNYPDIRLQAAVQLGRLGTAKASGILIQICGAENDIYVLRETIKALGDIGMNENDNTVKVIIWKVRGFNQRPADNNIESILFSAIDAFDKIDKKNDGIKNEGVFKDVLEFLERVSQNDNFSRRRPQGQISVQDRAKTVREDMLRRDAQRKQDA
ncbi:MAG: HEAT repeat domain-containing protein [Treponema sp.]|jgi:hypothetical protein|nr:HEAT repeat domain-containing protein [Treponema sp.]